MSRLSALKGANSYFYSFFCSCVFVLGRSSQHNNVKYFLWRCEQSVISETVSEAVCAHRGVSSHLSSATCTENEAAGAAVICQQVSSVQFLVALHTEQQQQQQQLRAP